MIGWLSLTIESFAHNEPPDCGSDWGPSPLLRAYRPESPATWQHRSAPRAFVRGAVFTLVELFGGDCHHRRAGRPCLLPAVQAAREAARRSQCQNNIRQLGLGIINHESSMQRLPVGFSTSPSGDVQHTWAAYSLPYLEAAQIFDQIDLTIESWRPYVSGRNLPWVYTQLSIHLCPSDVGPKVHTGVAAEFAHGNYLANQGIKPWWQANRTEAQSLCDIPEQTRGPFQREMTAKNRGLELRQISDGTSNTAMLGEVRQMPGFDARGLLYLGSAFYSHEYLPNTNATDYQEWCAEFNGAGRRLIPETRDPSMPCDTANSASRGPYRQTSRSQHPGGVHVTFCDNHVEFITDDVDQVRWRAISTRAGADDLALVDETPPVGCPGSTGGGRR
jgi:prepilin-type processing-associated H-X9-DG protein